MKRQEVHQHFPALYRLIEAAPAAHPLWTAIESVTLEAVHDRKTLLPTLERIAEVLSELDGHRAFVDRLLAVRTHAELMHVLSQLYVAYLYRNHGPRIVHGNTHFHLELSVADQLLALGVVHLHSLDSLELQFRHEIHDVKEFMQQLAVHARDMKTHAGAHHHVFTALSSEPSLRQEINMRRYVQEHQAEMREHFPHVSGVVLIHTMPDKEEATFVPFHQSNSPLEWMLTKES